MAVGQQQDPAGDSAPPENTLSSLNNNEVNVASTRNSSPVTKSAVEWKDEGNQLLSRKEYRQAMYAYEQALAVPSSPSVRATIQANCAQCLVKQKEYAEAEQVCSNILRQPQHAESILYKVYYRRALAREGLVQESQQQTSNNNTLKDPLQLLQAAKKDLQESLATLEATAQKTNMPAQEYDTLKIMVSMNAAKLAKLIKTTQQEKLKQKQEQQQKQKQATQPKTKQPIITPKKKQSSMSSFSSLDSFKSSSSATGAFQPMKLEAVPEDLPDPKSQRQDLVTLLAARHKGLQHLQSTQQQQQSSSLCVSAAHGEAFYVVNWQWWCDFCEYIDFFCWKQPPKQIPVIQSTLLSYFPPGAAVPPLSSKDNDEDNDDDEKMTGEDEEEEDEIEPPGPIDNSKLFLLSLSEEESSEEEKSTQQLFLEQWYDKQKALKDGKDRELNPLQLKPNLVRGYHYEIIPREMYSALRDWYGEVTPSICRRAVKHFHGYTTVPLYLLDDEDDVVVNNSISPQKRPKINYCAACRASHASLRCAQCLASYYCDRTCQQNHWPFHKLHCTKAADGNNGKSPPMSMGTVGLNNLGNTCFMNSALQCLSHATPLTRHFLSGRFKQDLNPTNPLGTKGKLATAYEQVLKEVWMKVGIRSTSPTALKRAIAQFAPRFAGYLQHDAQEFLAYLLDGLHEDLNRIRKAPYVENPDVGEKDDMAVAGARAWDAHLRRNDSLVMDTFYGQFKSTCVCPKCNRVSVSFDAFNHVSLEIPQQQNAIVPVSLILIRACTPKQPGSLAVRYAVNARRNQPIIEVMMELSKLSGVPLKRLHLCEVQDGEIIHLYRKDQLVSEIKPSDMLAAYEAQPFEDEEIQYFHTLLKHVLINTDRPHEGDEVIGVPLLLSFPANMTCSQVWEHLWTVVQDKVDEDYSERFKEVVRFRVVNAHKEPIEAFPIETPSSQEGNEEQKYTSLIPRTSNELLVKFLGQKSIDNFLLLDVEWRDLSTAEIGKSNEEEDESVSTTASGAVVEEDRFTLTESHPSWIDAMARAREQAASRGVTLDQCFETFVKPERLDEKNMWYCSSCKEHVRAMKTMELWRLPNILVVHLKRFEFKNAIRRDKLDTLVDFPLNGLNMNQYCGRFQNNQDVPSFMDESVPAEYDLFAVVNHFGRMGFGHYTAFARNWGETNMSPVWQLYDDSTVRTVGNGEDSVVSQAAYVLFYRRRIWH